MDLTVEQIIDNVVTVPNFIIDLFPNNGQILDRLLVMAQWDHPTVSMNLLFSFKLYGHILIFNIRI